jgi:hypothetical protein
MNLTKRLHPFPPQPKASKEREYRIRSLMQTAGLSYAEAEARLEEEELDRRRKQSAKAKKRNLSGRKEEDRAKGSGASPTERIKPGSRSVQGGAPGLKQQS